MTELPTTFGKYFLTEKLATGGMAEIYLAKLTGPGGFEKQLVIKQIHPRLTGQRHFVDLFVAEAKTLVTLAHSNIIPLYELGVIDDTYFIAMEYIDGPTLYRLTEAIARKAVEMDPAIAALIAAKILEGLDYAHRKGEGVIHRDLSPRNVMLSRDGEVKLVDFGIAVTFGATDAGSDTQSAPTGSFPYMSPEQVRREPLTGQTDLFSVGVLLWEMLIGQRLFARPDADATLAAVTDGPIARPSEQRPNIPPKLDEVVMRALERDQTVRWASAAEMLGALQRYLYGLENPPGPREVAALVAKYCPPETRRLPTHAEHPAETPIDDTPTPPAGPRTAVIDPERQPRGKGRARTETFATNVDLENMLAVATPLMGITKLPEAPSTQVAPRRSDRSLDKDPQTDEHGGEDDDDIDRDPTPVPPPEPLGGSEPDDFPRTKDSGVKIPKQSNDASSSRLPRAAAVSDVEEARVRPKTDDLASSSLALASSSLAAEHRPATSGRMKSIRPDSEPIGHEPGDDTDKRANVPGQQAPNRMFLLLVAIGSTILAIGAVYIFQRHRGSVLRPDAGEFHDAPWYAKDPDARGPAPDAIIDAPIDASIDAPIDGPEPRDAPPDTKVLVVPPGDGGKPKIDAGQPVPDAVVAGLGSISVGANPWADILLDGVKAGRAPKVITEVAAGKHTLELTFSGDDPPKTKTFTVVVKPGETASVLADFTK